MTFFVFIRLFNEGGERVKNDLFEKIYGQYSKELYLYIFSMCKDHYMTEELVSDTFFKALASVNNMEGHIKYWLFRVARNLWVDRLRKERKSVVGFKEEINNNWDESKNANPAERLINSEKNNMLYRGILNLPDKYKEVITLYYFCDYSLKEISKITSMTPGAARTLLYRARNILKEELKDVID